MTPIVFSIMNGVLFVLGIFVIILLLFVPTLEYKIKLRRRAKTDYLHARGTHHRNIIQSCLVNLNHVISNLENTIQQLHSRRSALKSEKERELEIKLTTQIVDRNLEDIPGIGGVLKERILRRCFDGTLESLLNARVYVRGIGDEKNYSIFQWVRNTRAKLPQLLRANFSGKSQILTKYAQLDRKTEEEIRVNNSEHERLQHLRGQSLAALDGLGLVNASTFLNAHKGDNEAAKMVTHYLVGVFPEWKRRPQWFTTLIKTYNEA